jgi:putative selenate reductase molybdopterin-binding subunit
VPPAVANAIASASGARMRELPMTPMRVWQALRGRDLAEVGAA